MVTPRLLNLTAISKAMPTLEHPLWIQQHSFGMLFIDTLALLIREQLKIHEIAKLKT